MVADAKVLCWWYKDFETPMNQLSAKYDVKRDEMVNQLARYAEDKAKETGPAMGRIFELAEN